MSIHLRRLIYIIFITIFIIIAPLLVFYSIGYRYNFKKDKIEKVGVLYLESEPKKAQVYINGKLYPKETPVVINNLLSNEYEVRIEKNDYYSWQKKLTVHSSQTTFAQNIILFKKTPPELIIPGEITSLSLSPNKNKIAYIKNEESWQELWILDLINSETTLYYRLPIKSKNEKSLLNIISWSPDSLKIILDKPDFIFNQQNIPNYFIIDSKSPKSIVALKNLTNLSLENVKWDTNDATLLYGLNENNLYQINLTNKKLSLLAEGIKSDYFVQKEMIYYFLNIDEDTYLTKRKALTESAIKIESDEIRLIKLPRGNNYIFKNSPQNFLTLIDNKKQTLYLIESELPTPLWNIGAKEIAWNKKNNLLYYDNFELWIYFLNSKEKKLITRYSQLIDQAFWDNSLHYLLLKIDNSLKAIELDARGQRNVLNLISEGAQMININEGNVYFVNEEGLFELKIH